MTTDTDRKQTEPRPSAKYHNGARWRGEGLNHRTDLHKRNGIYGTGTDFPIHLTPRLNMAEDFEKAAEYASRKQPNLAAWLNFERTANNQVSDWSAEDWEIWSYHWRAAWTRELDGSGLKFGGCMIYNSSPDKDWWHTRQWDNTEAIRIPGLVCMDLYTGPHQQGRFESLQRSRANGYDLACFVGLVDQSTSPSHRATFRDFSEQIKLAARLITEVGSGDDDLPPPGEVVIVIWDAMPGHPNRSSDADWDRALGYANDIVTIVPPVDADADGSAVAS